jgi:HAD superfamily phosphatase (TIGR01668 family)
MGIFYPKEYIDSTYDINFLDYYKKGYRGIIFDIDNTLVMHGAPADKRCLELFEKLMVIGFECILLSNNKEERVKSLANNLNVKYIYKANKPFPKNYKRAAGEINCDLDKVLFVGDQIFTDVMGANLAGIYSILVKPINKKEEIQIILKRIPEKIVLFFYRLKNKKLR